MSDLQERITGLSPERRQLLERLLHEEGVEVSRLAIRRQARTSAGLPLSYAQRRLWFLDQMEPGSSIYNIFHSLVLDGPVDTALVERSLNEIVQRHESLRTTFATHAGEPVQVIAPKLTLPLQVFDLRRLPPAGREASAARIAREEARRPFDLARGPLLRATLLRADDAADTLLLSMHHIISDAWSVEVLEREFRALYTSFSAGGPASLAPLPIQYADFAAWQREWLQGGVLESQLSYWKTQLAGAPLVLELPIARARPRVPTCRGATQWRGLPPDLARALKSLSQREGVTLFMLTLAAFAVLLCRYTDQRDIIVGTPVAGRNRAETEPLIGFFVNTLVLRTDLSGDPTFRELLRRVREACLGAFAHQDLPFEMLVEALQPERDPGRNPLFQVSFQLSSLPPHAEDRTENVREPADELRHDAAPQVEPGVAKFDLSVNVWDDGRQLQVQADYRTDLFEDASIARLLGHFARLLGTAVEHPDQCISRLSLVTNGERHRVLELWNATATAYPRDARLDELFEQQAVRTPEALAVTGAGEQLTYAALNARAAQLGRDLRALGVGPETLVGILLERSVGMVVAMLGILKAGAAYVPLDPEYPARRLAFLIQDAAIGVLLTQRRLAGTLPDAGPRVLYLDADGASVTAAGAAAPARSAGAEGLAYVIYTSGSTGTPKGVAVSHRAVTRTVCNTNYLDLDHRDRIAQLSNASFDAATFEIWGALVNGATLVVIPKEVMLVPERLVEETQRLGITVLFLTTAVLNQVAASIPTAFKSLRCLLFGGEAADPRWVRVILEAGPPGRLLHMYGPTESTTFASWHRVEAVPAEAPTVPIGGAVSNTQIYLLDRHLEPVPVGVAGELYIGGEGLARGYLNHPAWTAERFIPNPFSQEPGARLYRSGDVARYRADGAVEFIGRRDAQVKVRGCRIELGEVESLLREHPGVQDVVALCRDDARGDKRVVAYVVARDGAELAAGDLRHHLQQRAPDYLVPSAFVSLAELPLTPNGKIDRAALPSPERANLEAAAPFVPPATPVEQAIADIYASVLRLDRVGSQESFFELGGHSLLATQIMARVRERFRVDVPLRGLFLNPTVAGLAAAVTEVLKDGAEARAPAIGRVAREQHRATVSPAGRLDIPEGLRARLLASRP